MKIVSLAPHDIAVCASSGAVPAGGWDFVPARRSAEPVYRFPSRGCAKATAGETPCRDVMGIPVLSTACRAPEGLSPYREGVMRIVSSLTAPACRNAAAGATICSSRPARSAARATASAASSAAPLRHEAAGRGFCPDAGGGGSSGPRQASAGKLRRIFAFNPFARRKQTC